MNLYKALRIVALRDVLVEPSEYHLRFIQRWYSTTFHVPLPQVPDLPLEHVLQAFYESKYEDMSPEEREDERTSLLESDEDRVKRLRREDSENADNFNFVQAAEVEAARQERIEATKKAQATPIAPVRQLKESELPQVTKVIPPDITMKFIPDDEFQRLLEREAADDPRHGNLPLKPVPTQ